MTSDKKNHVLRVTVEDLETGEKDETLVPAGEYVVIVTDPAYVAGTQVFKSGQTHVITVKDRKP